MNKRDKIEPATTAMTWFDERSRYARVVFVLGAAGAYILVFITLYSRMGPGLAALSGLPVIAAGWLLGLRAGLVAWFLLLPVNTLLFNMVGLSGWVTLFRNGGGPGTLVTLIIVAVAGRLFDLREQLKREITERKQAEDALRNSHDRLEVCVAERTADLEETNRELRSEIANRKQLEKEAGEHRERLAHVTRLSTMGEIATGLAHEVNQPLTAIANFCYAGKKFIADAGSPDTEQLQRLFEDLSQEAIRAGEIIRRLRRLVGKKVPVRSQVHVVETIQEVLHLLEPDFRQGNISVELQVDQSNHVAIMDEIQIQQVLVNLSRNAVDAMGDTVRDQRMLKITTSRTADDLIEVAVCDTGKGIPVESSGQVFDAFFSTKSDGMGMGLAISRTIIESHGGRLWMTPNSDRGVTFHFTLPIAKEEREDDGG